MPDEIQAAAALLAKLEMLARIAWHLGYAHGISDAIKSENPEGNDASGASKSKDRTA